MKTKKLTPLQQELYEAMQNGAICYWMPYMGRFGGAYYFRNDTMKHCTAQARALRNAGLVEVYDEDWRGHKLRVKKVKP